MKFLEEDNWSACFKDWKNLAVMVRLAPGGSVKVIAGHDQKVGTCAHRDVTRAFCEIKLRQARAHDEFTDSHLDFDDYGPEAGRVPLERSGLRTVRISNFHVDTARAVKAHAIRAEQTALMLYKCFTHEVDIMALLLMQTVAHTSWPNPRASHCTTIITDITVPCSTGFVCSVRPALRLMPTQSWLFQGPGTLFLQLA